MTEQTTAQRIQDMLDMNFNFYPGPPGVTAKTIAAEIERLTAEVASKQETIDMLLEDERDAFRHERAQLETQLAKARAEVARREADLSTARITITEVESERNGANAFLDEVAFILQMPPAYMGGVNGWAQVKMQGLAEARAWKPALDAAVEALTDARAQIAAKDKRIAELEQLAALSPIKVGDISITLGLTETGEARMTFDGADDATLAVVAGKFALAMQATMESAKDVPNA